MRGQLADELPEGVLVATAPTPFNTLLWRGLIETEEAYYVTYWSPFDRKPAKYDYLPKQHALAERFEGEKIFESLKWFARDHWVARQGPDGKVVFIDVRFGELRNLDTNQLLPMFQWHMEYDEDGKMKADSYRPRDFEIKRAVGLILERIGGVQVRWESMRSF
jgi:inner membrane protein